MGEVRADTIFFGKGSITKERSLFQKHLVSEQLRRVGANGTISVKDSPLEQLARDTAAAKIRLERKHGELQASQEKLGKTEKLVRIDPMTGLLNKRAFSEALSTEIEETIRTNAPFTVLYLDLDNFKSINDKFGHDVGDRVIIEVAKAYRRGVRPYDIVGRVGGDEFAVIVKGDLGSNQVEKVVKRITKKFSKYTTDHPQFKEVVASIGAVRLPQDGFKNTKTLLKAADDAMTHAKINKKQPVQYWEPGMRRNITAERR